MARRGSSIQEKLSLKFAEGKKIKGEDLAKIAKKVNRRMLKLEKEGLTSSPEYIAIQTRLETYSDIRTNKRKTEGGLRYSESPEVYNKLRPDRKMAYEKALKNAESRNLGVVSNRNFLNVIDDINKSNEKYKSLSPKQKAKVTTHTANEIIRLIWTTAIKVKESRYDSYQVKNSVEIAVSSDIDKKAQIIQKIETQGPNSLTSSEISTIVKDITGQDVKSIVNEAFNEI